MGGRCLYSPDIIALRYAIITCELVFSLVGVRFCEQYQVINRWDLICHGGVNGVYTYMTTSDRKLQEQKIPSHKRPKAPRKSFSI